MNKDNLEGGIRSAVGQGEKFLGQAMNDKTTTAQGHYDEAAGKARSAMGGAQDAVHAPPRVEVLVDGDLVDGALLEVAAHAHEDHLQVPQEGQADPPTPHDGG